MICLPVVFVSPRYLVGSPFNSRVKNGVRAFPSMIDSAIIPIANAVFADISQATVKSTSPNVYFYWRKFVAAPVGQSDYDELNLLANPKVQIFVVTDGARLVRLT